MLLPAAQELVAAPSLGTGEHVLDLGCGTGNAALLAAAAGTRVVAVDPSVQGPHELVMSATSPEAFLEAEMANHPLAVAGSDVLRRCRVFKEARERLLRVVEDHNEDDAAFAARAVTWSSSGGGPESPASRIVRLSACWRTCDDEGQRNRSLIVDVSLGHEGCETFVLRSSHGQALAPCDCKHQRRLIPGTLEAT